MRWAWSSISEVTKSFVGFGTNNFTSMRIPFRQEFIISQKASIEFLEKKKDHLSLSPPLWQSSGWCEGKQRRKLPNLMAELIGFRLQKDHRANFLIGIKYLTAICLYVCPTRDFLLPLAVASLVFHEILLPLKSLFSGEIKIFGIHFLGSLSPNNYLSNANILTFLILPFVFF